MRSPVAACLLLLALSLPAVAAADVTPLGIKSNALDVAMTGDGSAYVVRIVTTNDIPSLVVCRIPTAGTTCTEVANRALPDTSGVLGDPYVVTDGNAVTAAVGYGNGASGRTFAMSSPSGTGFWGSLVQVANVNATDVELSPAGDRLWISAQAGPKATDDGDYLAFTSAPLPGLGSTTDAAVLARAQGGRNIGGELIGITPEGKPLAFLDGSAPDLPSGAYYRPFTGTVNDNELRDATKWGPPVNWDLPDPFKKNGSYDVSSANGSMWVGYEGLGRDTVLRQYVAGSLAPPVTPDCTTDRFASGLQAAPDVAITRNKELLITEVGGDGTNLHLGFFHGSADGKGFSPYQELATAPYIGDVETAADPTSDTGGIAVWTSDPVYEDKGELSFTRLPPGGIAPCPPVTPGPTATPSPMPTIKPTKTVSSSIGGAKLTLTLPNVCVAAGKKYTVRFAYKKHKKAKLKKVVKVVFSATGSTSKQDKKKPYSVSFTIPKGTKSGKKITVKAKVTVKLKGKKKTKTKTVKASFAAC